MSCDAPTTAVDTLRAAYVSLTVVQTRGSEHFVSIWETTFLYEHPCSWISTKGRWVYNVGRTRRSKFDFAVDS